MRHKTVTGFVPHLMVSPAYLAAFGGYVGLLENALDAVRGTAALAAPGRDGMAAVALVEAIKRSVAGRQTVMLDEAPPRGGEKA